MPARRFFLVPFLVAAALSWAACDTAPGPSSSAGDPPTVSDFSFDPAAVEVGGAEQVEFTLTMAVTAIDPDDDLEEVGFVVQHPSSGEPVAEGRLESADAGRFEQSVDISLPTCDLGAYTVLVYAIDARGALSNDVRGMLRVLGSCEPPVVVEVVAPDVVTRPAQGVKQVTIVAVVSDPDGLSNISSVVFWNVTNPTATVALFDGGENGDAAAGDGRYSYIIELASTNEAGENRFAFQATDKAGLKSNIVEKTIVVE